MSLCLLKRYNKITLSKNEHLKNDAIMLECNCLNNEYDF